MTRRFPRIGAWLTLSFVLALAALWLLSYAHTGVASVKRGDNATYFLSTHDGRIAFGVQSMTPPVTGPAYRANVSRYGRLGIYQNGNTATEMGFDPHWMHKKFLGFGKSRWRGMFTVGGTTYRAEANVYAAPWWAATLLGAAPAAWVWARWYRLRRRLQTGRCARCGYDLRESPARCPECGAATEGLRERLKRLALRLLSAAPRLPLPRRAAPPAT